MNSSNRHRKILTGATLAAGVLGLGALATAFLFPLFAKAKEGSEPTLNLGKNPVFVPHSPEHAEFKRLSDLASDLTHKADALFEQGKLSDAKKLYEEAAAHRDAALVKMPGSYIRPSALYGLAQVADKEGKTEEAKSIYAKFLSPDDLAKHWDTPALIRYSELCRETGDVVEERRTNRRIIEKAREDKLITPQWEMMGPAESDLTLRGRAEVLAGVWISYTSSSENKGKALQHFEAAVAANPRDPVAHYFRGRILERTGRFNEALQAFQTARKYGPLSERLEKNLDSRIGDINRMSGVQYIPDPLTGKLPSGAPPSKS